MDPGPSSGVTAADLKAYTTALNAHIASTRPGAVKYAPSNEWSEADKQLFFPALSRHSTRRTDLIARDAGKTEEQVERYLGLLAAGTLPKPKRAGRVGKDEWTRGIAPAARQIGEKRIREEEELAELLKDEEIPGIPYKPRADPLAGNKNAKILRDEQTLTTLLCIANRTLSQEREVRRLKEKKKMRHRYRRSRLIEEGMTDEQITAAGGPDTIYLTRAGLKAPPAEDPLRGNKHAKISRDEARLSLLTSLAERTPEETAEIRRLTNKKRARQRSRKERLRKEGMTEEQINEIDVDEEFAKRAGFVPEAEEDVSEGIWDYAAIHRRIGDLAKEVLDGIEVYLLAYLVPVVYRAITVAEKESSDVTRGHVEVASGAVEALDTCVKEEADLDWEIHTTTTDLEEEELDELLDDIDTAQDQVEGAVLRGDLAAKRDEYLRLLHVYTRRQARRAKNHNGSTASDSDDSIDDSGSVDSYALSD